MMLRTQSQWQSHLLTLLFLLALWTTTNADDFSCNTDSDCRFSYSEYCVDGTCKGCRESDDCGRLLVCGTDNYCTICEQDSHCQVLYDGTRPFCDQTDNNCYVCLRDSHCRSASKPYCNTNIYYNDCVGCRSNDHCNTNPSGPFCNRFGQCSQCASTTDCPTGTPICTNTGNCVQCSYHSHCSEPTPNCLNSECTDKECNTDSDCPGRCDIGGCSDDTCEDNVCVCFAPHSTVQVQTSSDPHTTQVIPISELGVGQKVLTSSGDFQKVIAFSTYSLHGTNEFIKITTEFSKTLELTPRHMIFIVGQKYPMEASKVRVGDSLVWKDYNKGTSHTKSATVTSVEHLQGHGGIAPITQDGTIVVDGVVASCYSNPHYQIDEYVTIFGFHFMHRHYFTHMLKAPVRLICNYITDAPCQLRNHEQKEGCGHKMPGHLLLDEFHRNLVIRGGRLFEDLGEVLVAVVASCFYLFEGILNKWTLWSSVALALLFRVLTDRTK